MKGVKIVCHSNSLTLWWILKVTVYIVIIWEPVYSLPLFFFPKNIQKMP